MHIRSLIFVLLLQNVLLAQDISKLEISEIKSTIKNNSKYQIDNYSGLYKEEVKEFWEDINNKLTYQIDNNGFNLNAASTETITTLLNTILNSNPNLDKTNYIILLAQNPIPNAACYGNKVITINTGLLNILESDDELAFVICHEIAHQLLRHNKKALDFYLSKSQSKEALKRKREARKSKYGSFSKLQELNKNLIYASNEESRTFEIEADSIGLTLYRNTPYAIESSKTALEKLNFSLSSIFSEETNISQLFSSNSYPFKSYWTNNTSSKLFSASTSLNDDAFDPNKIKTHPDIPQRISRLGFLSDKKNKSTSTKNLNILETENNTSQIDYNIKNYQLDFALYFTLSTYSNQEITKEKFSSSILEILKILYTLKLEHQVNTFINLPSPFSSESQIEKIRLLIKNIEPKDIRNLGYNFSIENAEYLAKKTDLTDFFTKIK